MRLPSELSDLLGEDFDDDAADEPLDEAPEEEVEKGRRVEAEVAGRADARDASGQTAGKRRGGDLPAARGPLPRAAPSSKKMKHASAKKKHASDGEEEEGEVLDAAPSARDAHTRTRETDDDCACDAGELRRVVDLLVAELKEPPTKRALVEQAVILLGPRLALKLLEQTRTKESRGGLRTADGKSRRSPGGAFFTLMKDHVDPEAYKKMYRDEEKRPHAPRGRQPKRTA
ncbi:PHAX RNA-binding domain-containing protein [Pelagophyceae sp. CCMP2097]|nr:PHAX RNA-binding domain-containing protein [Pelagophyceae sp. CCMP2097]|mmetsp:Transcript_29759/g.100235  ORF Transcript_29759/g.100235 Transcript_29759/m.100235 type:complete len:230 (-) Transcript_29759:13-702(-)